MPMLKYKDPADGLWKPVPVGAGSVNEVVISSTQPSDPAVELWLDEDEPGGGAASGVPTGAIMMWFAASPPAGWALCNGALLSRTTYRALFEVIGVTHGIGDGITTFASPDLSGRFIVGLDATQAEFDILGRIGGEKKHTLSIPEMPTHTHGIYPSDYNAMEGAAGSNVIGSHLNTLSAQSAPAGNGVPHYVLPPYTTLNFIIKL